MVENKELQENTKMRIYKTVFIQTLLYGTESVAALDKHKSPMQRSKMKYLRKVIGKTRKDQIRTIAIKYKTNNNVICAFFRLKLAEL
jgi:hypothetical protein